MATLRRAGFGSVFEVENETVGIGTTGTATNTVQVLGETKASGALIAGISTLTTYQGFIDNNPEFGNSNVDINSQSGTMGNIEICHGDFNVSSASTLTSSVNQLTLTNSFSVPTGDTDSRIHCHTIGSMRFNEELGTLEFYTGDEWRTVNSFKDTGNRGRGVFAGGRDSGSSNQTDIGFFNIASQGNAQIFGDLATARMWAGGASNAIRGLFSSGTPTSNMDYITIASEGNGITFGTCDQTGGAGSLASSTRALFGGGYSNTTNAIQYVEIMTLGNASDFGDLRSRSNFEYIATASNPVRGFFMANGDAGNNQNSDVDVVTIASKGNSVKKEK